MDVKQIYELVNTITTEVLGEDGVVQEDLSNLVDIGKTLENAAGLDNYVRRLNDHIGRVVLVNRSYSGRAPAVLMDGWEYGSIMEKIRARMPQAKENESWELQDGASYDPNIFYKPEVSAKFYNNKTTFEIPISLTELQVKSAFSNAGQMNAFLSMIQTDLQNSMTVKLDGLVMSTINAAIAETMYSEFPGGDYSGTGTRAVNLLKMYNDRYSASLTAAQAVTEPAFLRYAALQMSLWSDRLEVISTLFNAGGTEKFTPKSRQKIVLLSEFKRGADVYLQSDTFHNEFTKFPASESVTYWQGSGTAYSFSDTSKIDVKTPTGHAVQVPGVLGCIFDRDALGVTNLNRRVTNHWNPVGEFWNEWHKMDAGYFLDQDENMVVFYMA